MKKKRPNLNKQRFEVLPGEGRRFSFSRLKQALIFYVLLLLALVVIVQLGYHWLGEQFLAWRLQVVEAERGVIQQDQEVAGLITRREEVIGAPSSGMVLQLAAPGERFPAGTELAVFGVIAPGEMEKLRDPDRREEADDLWEQFVGYWQEMFAPGNGESGIPAEGPLMEDPGSQVFREIITISNEQPGFLSHYVDGWEAQSGPFYLSEEDFVENKPEGKFIIEGELLDAGQPLLKIVNNWDWFFNIVLPLHPGREIADYEKVDIVFDFAPEEQVRAELCHLEIDEGAREVRLTYHIEKQVSGFDQVRWTEASLLYRRQEGIIIPADAVTEKDHRSGVYLNKGGRVVFEPVTVIDRLDDKVLVEELDPYSLVITRPDLVEEGQRLN